MIEVYSLSESNLWDKIVRTFINYDVYYLSEYVKAFFLHGDGIPYLMYYKDKKLKAIYTYMKREISKDLYDAISPYGYGGVLFEGEITNDNLRHFKKEYIEFMNSERIIDNFVRYHPILANALPMENIFPVIHLGKTIAIDLSSPEIIWQNIISKNRNMIRKAEKNGVEIHHGKDISLFNVFIQIYNATMDKDKALNYYYFKEEFYSSIYHDLNNNYEIFYATYSGKIIAMSLIIFANNQMHYHLSGSDINYRNLAPSNLLLYKAALWGCEKGYKTFHLGGGISSSNDNLFKFKSAFNKNSDYQFSIGKEIFNQKKYDELVQRRIFEDPTFEKDSSYFPLYRA